MNALPKKLLGFGFLASLCILNLQVASLQAQNTAFTYQGRVTANGTNFTGNGQFKFALVTSTNLTQQATATANPPSGGFITIVNVTFGGSGYPAPPAVTFSGGGGSGVTAHATISGGVVTSITVDNPGSGYSSAPAVIVAPPPPNITFTTYWSNDGTSVAGSQPTAAVNVLVNGGLFTVALGDTTIPNMTAVSAALFVQPNLQLRIWFNDGVNGFAALSPVQNLTPTPYAVQAANAVTANTATTAASANSVLAANIVGTLSTSQLPGVLVTNNEGGVNLVGTFGGNGGGLSNISAASLVLTTTNLSITSWGWSLYGQRLVPPGLNDAVAVAAGIAHSLALRANGTVVAWGAGKTNDPASNADFGQSIVPPGLSNVTAVAAGYLHSLALKSDRTVVAWGYGTTNNPGTLESGQAIVPPGLSNVVAISAGVAHNLVLKTNGTVVAWGAGTTNIPTTIDSGQSIVPPGLNNVAAVSAGYIHSVALKADHTVVAWGAGTTNAGSGVDWGQSIVPPGLNNVIAVAAGGVHTLALKSDGTVVAWGAGTTNNPDDGINFGQSIVPPGLSNVVAIVAGLFHSVALKSDGTMVAWGDNTYGAASVPPGIDNIVALAPGSASRHGLALRKRFNSPVAWLDSDNTFNGNIQVNGDVHISGEITAGDGFRLNDGQLWLRGGIDQNNGLGWYGTNKTFGTIAAPAPDGPVLFGYSGGALGTTTNGQNIALFWDASQHVGIGTTTPGAPLSFGNDSANSKLLIHEGYPGPMGLGYQSGQFRFHLSGANNFERFSFLNAPGGTEVFGVDGNGNALLQRSLQLGATGGNLYVPGAGENLRIIRGVVRFDGVILAGTGFTVAHTGLGAYTLTFSPAFGDMPAVTATVQHGVPHTITTSSVAYNVAYIAVWNLNGTLTDQWFHFIAMGPR